MKQVKLICRHFSFSFIVLFASHALIANTTSTNFYQCETSKGVVFSQYPCSKKAKLKTISTFTPREIRDTSKDVKTLNFDTKTLDFAPKTLNFDSKTLKINTKP